MSSSSLQNRIDELETRLTFQDDIVASLNDALAQQQRSIMQLERSIEKLMEQIEESGYPSTDAAEEPPPHY